LASVTTIVLVAGASAFNRVAISRVHLTIDGREVDVADPQQADLEVDVRPVLVARKDILPDRLVHNLIRRRAEIDSHEHGARAAVIDDDRAREKVIAIESVGVC
jgi:hypothetical protein